MKVLIVIPVYNEEKIIVKNLKKLYDFAQTNLTAYNYKIIIADNNSSDRTATLVKEIEKSYPLISYEFFVKRGKGLAVMRTWQKYQNDFDIFAFMDADLSTDLSALPLLINSIITKNDIVIGSRYQKGASVQKPLVRHILSLGYRTILHLLLDTKINDFPCGFKAINKKILEQIVPLIKNDQFFFDTELVYLAEQRNFMIEEIPVKWSEPRSKSESKINLKSVSWRYLKEVWRISRKKY
ncbi:glycosyltransferase [Candidatus Falkowbacteria bacterium]|nr:glycosyltransferase [Candidatus Falkowbacteria bacterium]